MTSQTSPKSSQRTAVVTAAAPAALPFLSQAITCQGMVYCSGQLPIDPSTGEVVRGSIADRVEQCLANISAVLSAAGSSLENTVKMTIFLTQMQDFAALNQIYMRVFENVHPKPARTCVAVSALPMGTDVEMECVASL